MGKMLFVMVDLHSKWPEIQVLSKTSASQTITVLQEVFTRYGIPRVLVSNNGPQFIAEEFKTFMSANWILDIRSSPYHPSSNGAAKRLVRTVKRAIYAGHQQGENIVKVTVIHHMCVTQLTVFRSYTTHMVEPVGTWHWSLCTDTTGGTETA